MAGSAAASWSAQARLGSSHGAGWATCWLQLRARPLTQSQAIPLVLLAPDVYVPLDPLWSQDAHLLWVQTVGDKDPMNRPANAHFVAVSTLLFALHKGSLSVPDKKFVVSSQYRQGTNAYSLFYEFGWEWGEVKVIRTPFCLVLGSKSNLRYASALKCLSVSFWCSLCPIFAANANRAVLVEYMESIFVSIFVSFRLYSTCKMTCICLWFPDELMDKRGPKADECMDCNRGRSL